MANVIQPILPINTTINSSSSASVSSSPSSSSSSSSSLSTSPPPSSTFASTKTATVSISAISSSLNNNNSYKTNNNNNNNNNSSCDSKGNKMTVPLSNIDYLQELLRDKRMLVYLPNLFTHCQRLLDEEIDRVRSEAFHNSEALNFSLDDLPEEEGDMVTIQLKVYVPTKENPSYNFVGRLLGPAGMTAKQLEKDLDCKIMIRGRGSMRDKKREEQNRGKQHWEHLDEELHVLVSVLDTPNRANIKAQRAADKIQEFFDEAIRTPEKEDKLKQMQLMELAYKNAINRVGRSVPSPNINRGSRSSTMISGPTSSLNLPSNNSSMPQHTQQHTMTHAPLLQAPTIDNSTAMPMGGVGGGGSGSGGNAGVSYYNNDVTALLNGYAQMLSLNSEYLYPGAQRMSNNLYEYNNVLANSLNSSCGLYRTCNVTLPPSYYAAPPTLHNGHIEYDAKDHHM